MHSRKARWAVPLALATLAACGATPGAPTSKPASGGACDAAHLDACELAIASARRDGEPVRELVASWTDARASRASDDGWAKAYRELAAAKSKSAIVVEQGAQAPSLAGAKVVSVALPAPAKVDARELLVAIGEAAGVELLVDARPDGVFETFPSDPLGPMLGGLAPIARAEAKDLESDRAIDQGVRELLRAMSEFRYVDAARAADALEAKLVGRATNDEAVLRARFALNAVGGAGAVVDKVDAKTEDAKDAPPEPEPKATDTPYGDFLRVRTAKDDKVAWAARGAKILPAFPEDRRDAVLDVFGPKKACSDPHVAAPMAGARDLMFAFKLSGSLAPESTTEAEAQTRGLLPLAEWMKRYEAMVALVEQTKTAWFFATTLAYQRGESLGLSPAGTSAYKRVTGLVLAHLKAARALEEAEPAGFRAMTLLGLVYSPGALADPAIRAAVAELAESSVRDKLARAHDAQKIFESVFTGVLAGMTYPAPIQGAYYAALQGAFAAKVKGELVGQKGWGAAGLFAADGAYRVAMDQGPNPDESARRVAQALEGDPSLPQKDLAPLAVSAARYAALAATKKLDVRAKPDRFPPERKAARDALREALAALGAPGEAPNNVLDDVTELTDGLLATVAFAASRPKKPTPPGACAAKEDTGPDPETRRALAKLGDVRRRVLGHPRFKAGDGKWVRRARLLVTIVSDAMDLALIEKEKKPAYAIATADGERFVEQGLSEIDAKLAELARGLFRIYRAGMTAKTTDDFVRAHGGDLTRVLASLVGYFAKDAGAGVGVALVDALAKLSPASVTADLPTALTGYAKGFYARKQRDQGDLFLLGALLSCSLASTVPPKETLDLAAENQSRIRWGLELLAEDLAAKKRGAAPDPRVFGGEMRKVVDDACVRPDIDEMVAASAAMHDFATGKRKEGRAALDKVLDRMEQKGLYVPRVVYRYLEQTESKAFTVSVGLAMTQGLLRNGNTFQVGVGFTSKQEQKGTLTTTFDPPGSQQGGEEAARVYVHAASIAAAYAFLDGDAERGASEARRAASAVLQGVRLGDRPIKGQNATSFTRDARPILAVDAQLAAEAGMPLLAGDLLAIVKASFGEETDDAAIAHELSEPPLGLAGVDDAKPALDRATKTLRVLLLPLPCTTDKIELSGYDEPSCDAYPLAIGLRVADSLKKLPRLKRGTDTAPSCGALRSLDAFLGAAEKGRYDPDLFTSALTGMRATGRTYEAAVLLTRQRQPAHCSPVLVEAARALGRTASLGPALRADLLTVAVNCSAQPMDAAAADDLVELDGQTKALADPTKNLALAISLADSATKTDRWDVLARVADAPDFVSRWRSIPVARTAAQLVQDAVRVMTGKPPLDGSRATYELVCERFPPGERAPLCSSLAALRAPTKSADDAKARAKDALRDMVKAFSGPAAKSP